MNFQDDIPSIPVDYFKDHYVLVFDLTSMQDATDHCHHPDIIWEALRLELYFSSPQQMLQKSLYWVIVCLVLQSTSLVLWERIFEMDKTSLEQIVNRILLLKYRYMGTFLSDFVSNLQMTRLRLSTHSLATRQKSIG